ncbi:MAG: polysaccharide biosynthesis protein, partial [Lachnospiraceae bacterium]|nr:polysaccharide biosynthesis protein [Lachnospiraceae bacterium]
MGNKQKSKNLFIQGTILALAGIFTKIIGFVYRIPMTNMLGSDGNGVYSIAFEIYNIVLMLSSYSMPLAVSKLVSARLALKQYNNSYRVFKDTMKFALVTSITGALFLYFGSGLLASLYSTPELVRPLKVLAPTLLVVGILGVMRGFFQGSSTMIPTAISQIFEQIFNGVISIGAIWYCMSKLAAHAKSLPGGFYGGATGVYQGISQGFKVQGASFGAAGGTVGTLAGAVVALLFLAFTFVIYKPSINRQNKRDGWGITESHGEIYRTLLVTVVPVIISQTVYQVGYVIDDLIFSKTMYLKGMDNSVRKSLQGVFNSQYTMLINVPIAMATAMATSSIPSIVTSYTMGRKKEVNKKIGSIIKFVMVIAFPSAMGLSVLATPITHTLFPRLGEYNTVGASLLRYGSVAIVFYSLSTITSAILQGLDHMKVPVKNSGISLSIHLVLMVVLLYFTELNVYALLIGDITFPLLVSILNWNSVRKYVGYKQEVSRTFIVPLVV